MHTTPPAPHDPIASWTVERHPISGNLEAETAHDASGAPCARVEYDPATGRPSWINLRDDVAEFHADLAAARAELMAA